MKNADHIADELAYLADSKNMYKHEFRLSEFGNTGRFWFEDETDATDFIMALDQNDMSVSPIQKGEKLYVLSVTF